MIGTVWKFVHENIVNNIFSISIVLLGTVLIIVTVSVGPKFLQKEKKTQRGDIDQKVDEAFEKEEEKDSESEEESKKSSLYKESVIESIPSSEEDLNRIPETSNSNLSKASSTSRKRRTKKY